MKDRPVLKHIDLQDRSGRDRDVRRPNGCGKSTLIRILNALAFADLGTYEFDGDIIDEKSMKKESFAKAFHQKIGYVFQNPEAQLFCASVEEEIAFAPMQMGLPEEEVKRRVEDCIALLNLGSLRDRAPYYLSTGEKKKVAIASILSMNPKVLVLDEPLMQAGYRDRRMAYRFFAAVKKIRQNHDHSNA